MNLWLRLLVVFLRFFFRKSQKYSIKDTQKIHFFITPLDCDVNAHLTNSRYFSFMDLARLEFFIYSNQWNLNLQKKSLFPLLQGIEISFIEEILPFSSLRIETKILGLDEKYCYIEHLFYVNTRLKAHARARGVFVDHRKQRVNLETLQEYFPMMPIEKKSIQVWKEYLQFKKEDLRS